MKTEHRRILAFLLFCSSATHGFLSSPSIRRSGSALHSQQQQQQLQDIVKQVSVLEDSLASDDDPKSIQAQIQGLEQQMQQLEQIPIGLSVDEYAQACWTILQLPVEVRVTLWYIIRRDEAEDATTTITTTIEDNLWECATDVVQIPTLVTGLYEKRNESLRSSAQIMQQVLLLARKGRKPSVESLTTTPTTPATTKATTPFNKVFSLFNNNNDHDKKPATTKTPLNNVFSLFNNNNNDDQNADKIELTPEEMRTESMIQQLLPRVTRQTEATEQDLAMVVDVLRRKEFFLPTSSSPRRIPGGYCISGTWKPESRDSTATKIRITEQLKKLEEQFPKSFDAQLCWLPDSFSATDSTSDPEPFGVAKDPVLLLTKRDFTSSTSPIWSGITSLSAVATSIIFAVGMYGGNELVTTRLTQDYTGMDWFNGKILDLLLPLALVSLLHLSAQSVVAQLNQVKLSFPTLLPFWPLPWMGTIRRFNNSPVSRTALANVALAGPMVGLLASAALLFYGLQLTATAPAEVADYFPTLPVRVLQLSTAAGSAIDSLLGGAPGYYTTQTSSTAVPLHPWAVGGYVSLLVQAVDLLPLGATNGGRLSLALLGRQGHSVIGGLTWLILLLASLSDAQTDVLVGAWIVNNVVQNDPEVPCRDEVEAVGVPQAVSALFLWFVAALILTPLV